MWYFQCLTSSPPFQTASIVQLYVARYKVRHSTAHVLHAYNASFGRISTLASDATGSGSIGGMLWPVRPESARASRQKVQRTKDWHL